MIRQLKNSAKAGLFKSYCLLQRLGIDALPRHFYSEIPYVKQLRETDHWRQPYSLLGIDGAEDLDGQIHHLREWVSEAVRENWKGRDLYEEACKRNGEPGYGPVEADCLYAFVHTRQPSRIVQIGCGVSTALCLLAATDSSYSPHITCIEPYPGELLKAQAESGAIDLIQQPVENLSLDFLSELTAGDFFFVDSTHTLGPAGEVTRIILEMLPRLASGVAVHFHDIWLPYDYDPAILDGALFYWHETALLMAYLSGNRRCRLLASLSQLHHGRSNDLKELFTDYSPRPMELGIQQGPGDYPSAIYLEMHD